MNYDNLSLKEIQKEWHGNLRSYLIGFIACLILTSLSFLIVISNLLSGYPLIFTLTTLAVIQAIVQLVFFLHLGQEAKPRWETISFYFMVMVLLIIALGSLWIMKDLNERVMENMTMEKTTKEVKHD